MSHAREILAYTDGSCDVVGDKSAGAAAILVDPTSGKRRERSLHIEKSTNNVAELTAILIAMQAVKVEIRSTVKLVVFSDSQYAISMLSGDWKPKKNKALIASIRQQARDFHSVEFQKVRAHAGHDLNELVDALAKAARKSKQQ